MSEDDLSQEELDTLDKLKEDLDEIRKEVQECQEMIAELLKRKQ